MKLQKSVNKAVKAAANVVKASKGSGGSYIQSGKLKVPFKPASTTVLKKGKKVLIKQLKRRYVQMLPKLTSNVCQAILQFQ